MHKLGLTGGIGSGKTTVSGMFRELGAVIIDADTLAREALEPGQPAYDDVVRSFGSGVLCADGRINRKALADIVFSDAELRAVLENIIHPRVFDEERRLTEAIIAERPDAVIVFDAALMIESGAYSRMDKLAVVWCSPETQLERLIVRGVPAVEAIRRIAAQMPLADKRRFADYIIDNDGTMEETREQVRAVYGEMAG